MKRLLITTTTLISAILILGSFDWKAQPNEVLKGEMVAYAESFMAKSKGQTARELKRFIKKERKSQDPYSWIGATHEVVAKLKKRYPPCPENNAVRADILRLLDYPLHFNNFDKDLSAEEVSHYNKATTKYISDAKNSVLSQLKTTHPEEGMAVWKIYNMGVILRTPSHTVAIDISTPSLNDWSREDYKLLAEQVDIIFLTHPHSDHYIQGVIEEMSAAGKPVVLPCHLPFTKEMESVIVLDKSNETPINIAGIDVLNFMGDQGEKIPCNIYLLDIEGIRVIHNGDNYDREQEAKISNYPAANLIIASTWNKIQSILTAAMSAPGADKAGQLLIPAHENELNHGVRNRESYHEVYNREDRLGNKLFTYPETVLVDNGEMLKISARRR